MKEEDGKRVYRRFKVDNLNDTQTEDTVSKFACVKCHGEIDANPNDVFDLLTDGGRSVGMVQ